jgi:hypothetical protein
VWIWYYGKTLHDRTVSSACGDLTRWASVDHEGSDSWGLTLSDGRGLRLSKRAYNALPDGHYRIYYSLLLDVVNVKEHSDEQAFGREDGAPDEQDAAHTIEEEILALDDPEAARARVLAAMQGKSIRGRQLRPDLDG